MCGALFMSEYHPFVHRYKVFPCSIFPGSDFDELWWHRYTNQHTLKWNSNTGLITLYIRFFTTLLYSTKTFPYDWAKYECEITPCNEIHNNKLHDYSSVFIQTQVSDPQNITIQHSKCHLSTDPSRFYWSDDLEVSWKPYTWLPLSVLNCTLLFLNR